MVWVVSVIGVLFAIALYFNFSSVAGGVHDHRLVPCPDRPNCVCSFDRDLEHQIDPIDVTGIDDPMQAVVKMIESFPRAHLIVESPDYLHVVFRSKVFRFADDVEFYYIPEEKVIHVRSASRLGYRDFGVNRARIEKVRILLQQQQS